MRYTLHTLAGSVDYVLRRRTTSGPWSYDFHWNSKRHRDSTKSRDIVAAKEITEREIVKTVGASALAPRLLTLKDAVDRCVADLYPAADIARKRTRQNMQNRLKHFITERAALNVAAMSHDDMRLAIQSFIDKRKHAVDATTCDNDRRTISRLCSWLMARRFVSWPSNPALRTSLEMPARATTVKPPAADKTAEKMLTAAFAHPVYHAVFPVLVLMHSGFRPVGCTRVKWCDIVGGERPSAKVTEKGVESVIPLSAWAHRELMRYKAAHPPKDDNRRVFAHHVDWATEIIARLRKTIDPTFTLYGLRRRAYVRLYQAGIAPQKAAKIMRSSVSTALKHYVNLESIHAHDAAEALAPKSVTKLRRRARRKPEKRRKTTRKHL